MSLKIIGTGRALPQKAVSNDELSSFLDTSDEWITSHTGVKNRYVCTEESLTDLCESAAKKALLASGLRPPEIDLVLCSTMGGDFVTPSLACAAAERLGLSCPAFDLNAACSGFLYALDVAAAYLTCGRAKKILILSAEMMSKHVDWSDRATCVLFGDGAGACVVTAGTALQYLHLTAEGDTGILFREDGSGSSPFREKKERGFVKMQGQGVFKFAVRMIETQTKAALESLSLTADDIDYYLLHQANKRILDFAREKLGQPEEKFPSNIHRYGNISSASVPILLDELLEQGKIQKGAKLLMSAFGAGLTAGTCVMSWE
ncbi:MAG TPA: beta-ketoacyl-ACP synthase III [Oscillospiraceae bacterium]|nr:beta-ketoacyl-ACP synthase III [Oscillospiraceae bacterium]HRW56649.1 beta-ketoacyl-ACP synthase III [Oscillospiraceae bacterium]